MRLAIRAIATVLAAVIVGCGGPGDASPASTAQLPPPVTQPPVPEIVEATPVPSGYADRLALAGTGSKSSKPKELAGDYRLSVSVKAKPRCKWSLYIEPEYGLADSFETDAAGKHETTIDPVTLEPGLYRLIVKAKRCGKWTVKLTRS